MNHLPNPYSLDDLLVTKLEIPLIGPSIVPRRRLTEILKMGMERRLTLLTASAGYGKTTLLVEWISSILTPDWRVIWVTVDSFDNEPFRLWSYIAASLQRIYPRLHLTPQRLIDEQAAGSRFAGLTPLINAIAQVPYQLVLVLDDYQWINTDTVHEEMRYLLEHQPKNLHILISSRTLPPYPLAKLRAQRQLVEVTSRDLSFTLSEAKSFFKCAMKMDFDQDMAAALYGATEGWVAGLQLASLSLLGQIDRRSFIAKLPEKNYQIFEYLTEEVLDQQSSEIREFLLKTSILSELSAPLCDAVLDRSDSRKMLDKLQQANLFIIARDESQYWFSYHRLFSDTLQIYLRNTYPGIIPEMHRKACTWLQENGYPDKAVSHALAYGDLEQAARIIDACALQAVLLFNQSQLAQWIGRFSDDLIAQRPQLGIYFALANYLIGNFDTVEIKLRALEKSLANSPVTALPKEEKSLIRWEIAAIRACVDGCLGNHDRNIPAIMELLLDPPPNDVYFSGFMLHGLAQVYVLRGDLEEACTAYEKGCKYALEHGLILEYCYSRSEMAHIRKVQGRLLDAERGYQDMLNYAQRLALPVDMLAMAQTGLADVALEQNRIEQAGEYVRWVNENIERIEACPVSWVRHEWIWLRMTKYYLTRYDLDNALQCFEKAIQGYRANPKAIHYLSFQLMDVQVKILTATGELRDKDLNIQEQVDFFNPLGTPYPSGQAALARYSLAQGRLEEALQILADLVPALEKIGKVERLMNARILQALTYQKWGRSEPALQSLHQALKLAVPAGYRRIFIDEGEQMRALLEEYIRQPMDEDQNTLEHCQRFVHSVLNEFNPQTTPAYTTVSEAQPTRNIIYPLSAPLSHRELEILRLMLSGKSTKEIASALMVSINTAKVHIKSVYRKTGAHNRCALLKRATDLDLLID